MRKRISRNNRIRTKENVEKCKQVEANKKKHIDSKRGMFECIGRAQKRWQDHENKQIISESINRSFSMVIASFDFAF
jgi:hypothetical protein